MALSDSGTSQLTETEPPTNDDDDGLALTLGTVFEVLSSQWRRYVIYYLKYMPSGTVDVTALVDKVTAWEAAYENVDPSAIRSKVAEMLRDVHLPRLAEIGLIDHDSDADQVRYHGHGVTEDLLERVGELTY